VDGRIELDELRGDDGTVDADLVQAAVQRVLDEHPAWGTRVPDLGQGRRGEAPAQAVSWADALRQRS